MERLVFHHVSLFDGLRDRLVVDAVVVVERGRIAAVGRRHEFGASLPDGVEVDGAGGVLMPGLINCHEHQDTRGAMGSYQERVTQDRHYLVLRTARNGLLNLAAGITTVRDMASRDGISLIYRDAVASGLVRGEANPFAGERGQRVLDALAPDQPLQIAVRASRPRE